MWCGFISTLPWGSKPDYADAAVQADDSDEDGHVPVPPTELELDIDAPAGAQITLQWCCDILCSPRLSVHLFCSTVPNIACDGCIMAQWRCFSADVAATSNTKQQKLVRAKRWLTESAGDYCADVDGGEDQGRGKSALSREEKQQKMWEDYYRKQANQRRAELQQILHRSSALCTLANGLLLDQAANDPMLQVGVACHQCLAH